MEAVKEDVIANAATDSADTTGGQAGSGRDKCAKGSTNNWFYSNSIGDNSSIMKFSDIVVGKAKDLGKNFVGVLPENRCWPNRQALLGAERKG